MTWLTSFVEFLFRLLELAILIRVILSWLNVNPDGPIVSLVHQITDPILDPLQRIIPPVGPLDLTPFIAMILLEIVRSVLLTIIVSL